MTDRLKFMIGDKIHKLFLIVFPPIGEEDYSQIDMSIGMVSYQNPTELVVLSTDNNDLTTPVLKIEGIPENYYRWNDFNYRMENWMSDIIDEDVVNEYYDISECDIFQNIIEENIQDISMIKIGGIASPIGVQISFPNDFIISIPNDDGNTIETNSFNKNNSLNNFEKLGNVYFNSL